MIADVITFVLSNIPAICFVLALVAAFLIPHPRWSTPERYLSWMLLLGFGVTGIWGGFFHIFFPSIASAQIGWAPSPFETEMGIADAASGAVAVIAFWRSLAFKSAITLYAILAFAGVAIGHFYQAFAKGDYSPDNFGALLVVTVLQVVLLSWWLWASWRDQGRAA